MDRIINRLITIFIVPVCFLVTSCHFNSTYYNREADKKEGEKAVAQFYELLKNKDYKGTYKFFDRRFFEVTDTQKLNEIYDIAFEKLGNIESYDIERWETEAIVGTDSRVNYLFLCDVKRLNFASKETITLIKEKDEIKIISYHVNSDGFFRKEE